MLSSRTEENLESDRSLTKVFETVLKQIQNLEEEFLDISDVSLSRGSLVANTTLKWYQKPLKHWYKYKVNVMLISFALGKSDNVGARRFLEQEDVFNVSITRAKEQQIVFHSVESSELPGSSLLAKYFDSVMNIENDELRKNVLGKR